MLNWLGFERRVAVRFLREGRMQTVLIIVGVAAGVAVVAYISALITGLQRNTLEKTLGAQAHVTVSALDDVVLPARAPLAGSTALVIANWQSLLPVLERIFPQPASAVML
ncbi:MAG: hypothetical protein ABTS16_16355 [Candidatus Accumulibacter phosphatis]|jgi:lipoprotein-releasing system permease protein|uniref:hypothetical protein n=1 Tax=Candidatus Accumulibacter contiguus TaxID=2954381 RepID=UPI002FC2B8AB